MAKNVVVVGMPRSGTSLTMAVFARHGYYVGPIRRGRYREGDEHNPFGYFEADALVRRNAELFSRAGFPRHNTWTFERMPDDVRARLHALAPEPRDAELVASYLPHRPWAWKDPRLTYTIGYWWPLLDPADTTVVLMWRDPAAVVNSFRRMDWPVQPDLAARVREHFDVARDALVAVGAPHLVVDYEDYLTRPAEMAAVLGRHVGLDLGVDDLNVRTELDHSRRRGWRALMMEGRRFLPVGARRAVRRTLPRPVLEWLAPELRHVARSDDERQARGIPSPRA
jgi:hypothetical protein